jgi:hypothetical protein
VKEVCVEEAGFGGGFGGAFGAAAFAAAGLEVVFGAEVLRDDDFELEGLLRDRRGIFTPPICDAVSSSLQTTRACGSWHWWRQVPLKW